MVIVQYRTAFQEKPPLFCFQEGMLFVAGQEQAAWAWVHKVCLSAVGAASTVQVPHAQKQT